MSSVIWPNHWIFVRKFPIFDLETMIQIQIQNHRIIRIQLNNSVSKYFPLDIFYVVLIWSEWWLFLFIYIWTYRTHHVRHVDEINLPLLVLASAFNITCIHFDCIHLFAQHYIFAALRILALLIAIERKSRFMQRTLHHSAYKLVEIKCMWMWIWICVRSSAKECACVFYSYFINVSLSIC